MASRMAGSSHTGLHARLLNEIGQSIVSGEYAPGDQLPNGEDWSASYGASRTGLREVVKVLAGKGMVEMRPRTGTRVRPRRDWNFLDPDVLHWRFGPRTTPDDARSLFELRRAIEPTAGALAAERATQEQIDELRAILAEMDKAGDDGERFAVPDLAFHRAILHMSGNELIGSLNALLIVMKGLPLAYQKDMQEDKEQAFDAFESLELDIAATTGMVRDLEPEAANLKKAAGSGFSTATDLADWLVRALGLPFREAHHVTGRAVALAESRKVGLEKLSLADLQSIHPRITDAVFSVLTVRNSVKSRTSYGGTAPAQVKKQVRAWKKRLARA